MRVDYDRDAGVGLINSKTVAVIGFGRQGQDHALKPHDSDAANVIVGLCGSSPSVANADAAGLKVTGVAEAKTVADIVTFWDSVDPDN
jgi:ketol-acid reductoisomerase